MKYQDRCGVWSQYLQKRIVDQENFIMKTTKYFQAQSEPQLKSLSFLNPKMMLRTPTLIPNMKSMMFAPMCLQSHQPTASMNQSFLYEALEMRKNTKKHVRKEYWKKVGLGKSTKMWGHTDTQRSFATKSCSIEFCAPPSSFTLCLLNI